VAKPPRTELIYGVIAPQWSSVRKLHELSQSSLIAASISSGYGQIIIIVGVKSVAVIGASGAREECTHSCRSYPRAAESC